ncbi:MAG: hypothetical protein WDM96_02675 [Lacunisphaera sp.]
MPAWRRRRSAWTSQGSCTRATAPGSRLGQPSRCRTECRNSSEECVPCVKELSTERWMSSSATAPAPAIKPGASKSARRRGPVQSHEATTASGASQKLAIVRRPATPAACAAHQPRLPAGCVQQPCTWMNTASSASGNWDWKPHAMFSHACGRQPASNSSSVSAVAGTGPQHRPRPARDEPREAGIERGVGRHLHERVPAAGERDLQPRQQARPPPAGARSAG